MILNLNMFNLLPSKIVVQRLLIILFTCLAILSSASSCTLFGGSSSGVVLGVIKRDNPDGKGYRFGFINTEKLYTGEVKQGKLNPASGLKMAQTGANSLYLLTEKNGFFRTVDGGKHWERKYVFGFEGTATERRQIQREINAWLARNDSFIATDFVVDPKDDEIVYITGQFENVGRIFKTENGGNSFSQIYSSVEKDGFVRFVTVDPENTQNIYALAGKDTIIRSQNGGQTWQKMHTFERETVVQIGFYNDFSDSLFALLKNQGLAFSEDFGETWRILELTKDKQALGEQPTGIFGQRPNKDNPKFSLYEKVIPVQYGNYWVVIADKNIWFSDSLENTFLRLSLPTEAKEYETYDIFPHPTQAPQRMMVAVNNKLFETKDGGKTWSTGDKIGLQTPIGNIGQIIIDQNNDEIIYLMLVDKKTVRRDGLYQRVGGDGIFG